MSNYCRNCKHKEDRGKDGKPWMWECMLHPHHEINFVCDKYRLTQPYKLCKNINTNGDCPKFEKEET